VSRKDKHDTNIEVQEFRSWLGQLAILLLGNGDVSCHVNLGGMERGVGVTLNSR
jgi:hypothetical protein